MEISSSTPISHDPSPDNAPKQNPHLPFIALRFATILDILNKNTATWNRGDPAKMLSAMVDYLANIDSSYNNLKQLYFPGESTKPLINALKADINKGMKQKITDWRSVLGCNTDNPPYAADGNIVREDLAASIKEFMRDVAYSMNAPKGPLPVASALDGNAGYVISIKLFMDSFELVQKTIDIDSYPPFMSFKDKFNALYQNSQSNISDYKALVQTLFESSKIGGTDYDPLILPSP